MTLPPKWRILIRPCPEARDRLIALPLYQLFLKLEVFWSNFPLIVQCEYDVQRWFALCNEEMSNFVKRHEVSSLLSTTKQIITFPF